jgi:hypothetical protein
VSTTKQKTIKLSSIKPNPENPRLIKDDKFYKLLESIKTFGDKMMPLRPIVIDENNIILGGNMRFKALKELGYKEVPADWIKAAKDLTEEQKKEFIIKDNVGYGDWDWDLLSKDWDNNLLEGWALDSWRLNLEAVDYSDIEDVATNNTVYKDTDGQAMNYLNSDMKKFEIYVSKDDYDSVLKKLTEFKEKKGFANNSEAITALILNS